MGGSCGGPCRLPGTTRGGIAWRRRRGVGPLDGDAVVVGVLLTVGEGVAGDGHQHLFLGVEHSAGGVHAEALHVGGLDGPSDAAASGVHNLDVVGVLVIVGGVEDDLRAGLGVDVSWGTDWAMMSYKAACPPCGVSALYATAKCRRALGRLLV
ncbi:hypothetical protein L596_008979 [Steinernema carpocapsae]|uniref:Uncharacterized protein n=1 Tax=Steinernema carpocapsae TaxID=34508 RepID=A0A4U5PF67_STECR|nr:hypothetical protein L596_008979 [Steinernema carpocapsae]